MRHGADRHFAPLCTAGLLSVLAVAVLLAGCSGDALVAGNGPEQGPSDGASSPAEPRGAASSPTPPPIVFKGPLERDAGAWLVDSQPNLFYPDGARADIPDADQPTSYIAMEGSGCAVTSRSSFLSEHEGKTIVVTSDGSGYDVGDSNPVFLAGSWKVTDVACAAAP